MHIHVHINTYSLLTHTHYALTGNRNLEENFPYSNWLVVSSLQFVINASFSIVGPSLYQFVTTSPHKPDDIEVQAACFMPTLICDEIFFIGNWTVLARIRRNWHRLCMDSCIGSFVGYSTTTTGSCSNTLSSIPCIDADLNVILYLCGCHLRVLRQVVDALFVNGYSRIC